MVTINNSEVNRELVRAAKIQQSIESIPNQMSNIVAPTIEVNPILVKPSDILVNGSLLNSASTTMITLDSNKDFYITAASLGVIKDATSTSLASKIFVVINGLSQELIRIPSLSLTAQSATISNNYPHPIKVDRGSTITLTNSTAVANITTNATVVGFYDEASKA